tara:strand:+ start:150 stop:521 length:372 start_codon:yes stop_codon:yes gene_type:complete
MTTEKTLGTIQEPINVTDEHIDSILCGSFEGSCNYWIDKIGVVNNDFKGAEFASEVVAKGGSLFIYENGEKHLLTLEKMIKGCQLYVNGNKNTKGRKFDIYKWDAIDHDMILQYAIFGEVIYG